MHHTINVMAVYSMRSIIFVLFFVCTAMSSGCSFDSIARKIDPYRIDVRQGNYIDQEMVSQLRKGMTREQVQFVLGRPLLVDTFRTNRWDYVYYFKSGKNGETEQRVFSVFFDEQGLLDYVEGDVVTSDGQSVEAVSPAKQMQVIEILGPVPKKK